MDRVAIRHFFQTDRGLLLVSLVVSVVFWFLVKLSQEHQTQRLMDVFYTKPEEAAFMEIPPAQIDVTLRGRGWDLLNDYMGPTEPNLHFRLNDSPLQNININQIRAQIQDNLNSGNLIVAQVIPDNIAVQLGENDVKKVRVRAEVDLQFAANHHLQGPVRVEPDSITLYGPAVQLETVNEWFTDPLVRGNVHGNLQELVALQTPDLSSIQLSQNEVQVIVPVEQFTEKSIFLPVLVRSAPDSLKVFPDKIKATFVVGLSSYDTVAARHFALEVDLKDVPLNQTNNTAPVNLTRQPAEVRNVRLSRNAVTFRFVRDVVAEGEE